MNEDFCQEVRNIRGRLIPYSKHAKIRGYTAFLNKDKLALNGINRGMDTSAGQRMECNEETGQQDSDIGEHGNSEQQIQRRSYTDYKGLWKKVNTAERRLQLGTGSGSSNNNKNYIHN